MPVVARLRAMLTLGVAVVLVATAVLSPLDADAQDLASAREERQRIERRLETTTRELEELQGQLATREQELEQLAARMAELERQLAATEHALDTRVREAFKHGNPTMLEALVSGEGPDDAIDRAALLDTLARRDGASIESATNLRIQLEQTRQLQAAALADLERLQQQLDERIDALEGDLERARRTERDLELRAKRQRMIDRGMQRGIYSCPMARPYSFIDSWGFPRSGGRRHKGVDIMAPYGNEIYAFTTGRISRMSTSSLGGITLYLRGDDGNQYYYAHLSRYAAGISPGTRVDAGQLIAYNGDSGNARGAPHLHFEVHPGGGSAVNPYPWVAAACYG